MVRIVLEEIMTLFNAQFLLFLVTFDGHVTTFIKVFPNLNSYLTIAFATLGRILLFNKKNCIGITRKIEAIETSCFYKFNLSCISTKNWFLDYTFSSRFLFIEYIKMALKGVTLNALAKLEAADEFLIEVDEEILKTLITLVRNSIRDLSGQLSILEPAMGSYDQWDYSSRERFRRSIEADQYYNYIANDGTSPVEVFLAIYNMHIKQFDDPPVKSLEELSMVSLNRAMTVTEARVDKLKRDIAIYRKELPIVQRIVRLNERKVSRERFIEEMFNCGVDIRHCSNTSVISKTNGSSEAADGHASGSSKVAATSRSKSSNGASGSKSSSESESNYDTGNASPDSPQNYEMEINMTDAGSNGNGENPEDKIPAGISYDMYKIYVEDHQQREDEDDLDCTDSDDSYSSLFDEPPELEGDDSSPNSDDVL